MRPILEPVSTGTINGKPVRFFRSPSSTPDLPWHATDDLYKALGIPRDARRQLAQTTQASWPGTLRTIATSAGPVVIAPHYVSQGLLGALTELGGATADTESEYCMAGAEALAVLTGDLPPQAAIAFSLAAFHGSDGSPT